MDTADNIILGHYPSLEADNEQPLYLASLPYTHPSLSHSRYDLYDRDNLHKIVMSLHPDGILGERKRAAYSILFRDEPEGRTPRILIQTEYRIEPDENGLKVTSMENLLQRYRQGQRIRIQADLNSIKTVPQTGKRVPVSSYDLEKWVTNLLSRELNNIRLNDARQKTVETRGIPLRISTVTLDASILNLETFLTRIRTGVGKGKSYGCGLITALPLE